MKINAVEQKDEQSLNTLIRLTKPKEIPQYKKAEEEVLKGLFG